MTWQQFLTEQVLKECWHDKTEVWDKYICRRCGQLPCDNRTFDNRDDMMDLYEAIYKIDTREWVFFINFVFEKEGFLVMPVLFCLNGEGYADRCKTVAEFYGWEADHD